MLMQDAHQVKDLAFGTWPVIEAIKADKDVNKIILQKGIQSEQLPELMKLIKEKDIPFQWVPIEKLNKITRKNHQGVIAFLSPVTFQNIENIIPILFEEGKVPLIIALDGVTDVRNFGAICRTALCMGVHAIVIPDKGSALINADALKTSAGAIHSLPICRVPNLKTSLQYLKDSGIKIMAVTEKANKELFKVSFSEPTVLLMGSEDTGISEAYVKLADEKIKIPIQGNIQSLNVSVAAGMVLYECFRQRN
jgi:23S rRNA (guanosine2251-2'-O)-methyltransferase